MLLRCPKPGCPRKKKIAFEPENMHPRCAVYEVLCPWHSKSGDFESVTEYDANGKQLGDPNEEESRHA